MCICISVVSISSRNTSCSIKFASLARYIFYFLSRKEPANSICKLVDGRTTKIAMKCNLRPWRWDFAVSRKSENDNKEKIDISCVPPMHCASKHTQGSLARKACH